MKRDLLRRRRPIVFSRLQDVLVAAGENDTLRGGFQQLVKACSRRRMDGQPKSGPLSQVQDMRWRPPPTRGANVAPAVDRAGPVPAHPEHTKKVSSAQARRCSARQAGCAPGANLS